MMKPEIPDGTPFYVSDEVESYSPGRPDFDAIDEEDIKEAFEDDELHTRIKEAVKASREVRPETCA